MDLTLEAHDLSEQSTQLTTNNINQKSNFLYLPVEIQLKVLEFALGAPKVHRIEVNPIFNRVGTTTSLSASTAGARKIASVCTFFRTLILEKSKYLRNKIPLSGGGTLRYNAQTDIICIEDFSTSLMINCHKRRSGLLPASGIVVQPSTEEGRWMREVQKLAIVTGNWKCATSRYNDTAFCGSLVDLTNFLGQLKDLRVIFTTSLPMELKRVQVVDVPFDSESESDSDVDSTKSQTFLWHEDGDLQREEGLYVGVDEARDVYLLGHLAEEKLQAAPSSWYLDYCLFNLNELSTALHRYLHSPEFQRQSRIGDSDDVPLRRAQLQAMVHSVE